MSRTATFVIALISGLALAHPAIAQGDFEMRDDDVRSQAVVLFAHAGGFNGLTDLDDAGTTDFKNIGYNVGGGLGIEFSPNIVLRGNFTYARNQLELAGVETGSDFNRYFVDATLKFQTAPEAATIQPYLFLGGGAVMLNQVDTDLDNEWRGAGTAGIGFAYTIPQTEGLSLFAEGKGWVYQISDFEGDLAGVDETQVDIMWSGGVSYALPF